MSPDDWADCWICETVFARRRPTARRCTTCRQAYCEGEHGRFEGEEVGSCLRCLVDFTAAGEGLALPDRPVIAQDERPTDG